MFPPLVRASVDVFQRRPLWAGALTMFLVLVFVYSFSMDIRASRGASITGDEPFYLLTTQSLIEDGDLDLRQQYAKRSYETFFDHPNGLWRQSLPTEDGRLLSPHNPGLSVLLIPGFLAGGLRGAQVEMLLLAALTFALAYLLIAQITGASLLSWLATLAVSLTASAFIYSTEIYPEIPAALAMIISLIIVSRKDQLGPWRGLLLTLSLSAMVWMGIRYAPLALVVGCYFLLTARSSGRAVLVSGGFLSAAAFVLFHIETFGAVTPYSVGTVYAGDTTTQVLGQHLAFEDRAYRLWGLFIDQRFGLARWAPVLLPAMVGLMLLPWSKGISRLVLALVATQVFMATFVAITMMGWWFPGRTLVTVLPLFALPLTFILRDGPVRLRALVGILGLYSVAITAALAYAGHSEEITLAVDPFDMSSPVFAGVSSLFPNYTSWTLHTWLLTAVWLVLGSGLVGFLLHQNKDGLIGGVRQVVDRLWTGRTHASDENRRVTKGFLT